MYLIQVHQGSCQTTGSSEQFLGNGKEPTGSRVLKRLWCTRDTFERKRRFGDSTGYLIIHMVSSRPSNLSRRETYVLNDLLIPPDPIEHLYLHLRIPFIFQTDNVPTSILPVSIRMLRVVLNVPGLEAVHVQEECLLLCDVGDVGPLAARSLLSIY